MDRKKNEKIIYQSFSFIAVPVLAIAGVVFALCGIVFPIAGVIQMLSLAFHWDIPFIEYAKTRFMGLSLGYGGSSIVLIITGGVLLLIGVACFILLRLYIKKMKN